MLTVCWNAHENRPAKVTNSPRVTDRLASQDFTHCFRNGTKKEPVGFVKALPQIASELSKGILYSCLFKREREGSMGG